MHYVYVLQSIKNGQLYTGRTDNLKRRIKEHLLGKVYTTYRMLPIDLIYYEAFKTKSDTVRRERYLKSSKGKTTLQIMLRDSLKITKYS